MEVSVLIGAVVLSSVFDQDIAVSLKDSIAGGRWYFAFLASFLGGVLTSLTPCVYPLIPITVQYFGGMGRDVSRRKMVRLALIYIAGMSLLYTVLGTLFASLNLVFGSFLTHPGVVFGLSVMCIVMGTSMLGLFSLQLPTSVTTRLSLIGGKTAPGAFAMGLVSGLVAAPCTGPVLAVILAVIASSAQVVSGVLFMLAFSGGLGLPFLVLALASGQLQRLPRSGPWMELVKGVLAAAMFVVAIYFSQLAFPSLRSLFDWGGQRTAMGVVLIILSIVFVLLAVRADGARTGNVLKGTATVALAAGIATWAMGHPMDSALADQAGVGINWHRGYETGWQVARERKAPVFIDFTADWCAACKELDRAVFSSPGVQKEAERFVAIRLDVTRPAQADEELMARFRVMGLPAVLFFDSQGQLLDNPRIAGFIPPEKFLEMMIRVK